MAPIVLKVKGNMQSLLSFGNLDSSDDLSKTWRVCTKVKDSLENGSRLENLSWRLWFAHNVNNDNKKAAAAVSSPKAAATPNDTFKVPDNFDFKAQNEEEKEKKKAEYKRKLSLQQRKQAQELLQNNYEQQQAQQQVQQAQQAQQAQFQPATTNNALYMNQTAEPYYTNNNTNNRQFTLHQFTSDQAGDQVIELDDIFKSFGGSDMRAYLDPTEEQQLDNLINESWPVSTASSIHDPYSTTTSPTQLTFPSSINYNNDYINPPTTTTSYDNNNNSALYVSAEQMSPIPIGTLHNRLLATLPRETLESANRLLLNNNTIEEVNEEEEEEEQQLEQINIMYQDQSTPNTPFTSSPSSSSSSFTTVQMNSNTTSSSYRFFMPPQPTQQHHQHNHQQHQHQHYTFSHHNNHHSQHSKSLPPSRATSPPPPLQTANSASSSPTTTTPPTRRTTAPINTSPSEGKAPICSNCGTASTPLWRRSANDELLCNACGLYLKLHNAPRPKYLKPQSSRKDSKNGGEDENIVQPLCSNCGTSTTPLWRRDLDGAPLCNACGLYLKLHHEKRPLSMKTDNIKKRQRCDNTSTTNKSSASTTTASNNTTASFVPPSSTKKKNRLEDTQQVTFDTTAAETTYQYMEDIIPTTNNNNNDYSPFGTFGLTLNQQPM